MRRWLVVLCLCLCGATLMDTDIGAIHVWRNFNSNVNQFTQAAIQAQITAQGSTQKTIYLPPGTWTVSTTLTVPDNITLWVADGATIAGAGNLIIGRLLASTPRGWYTGSGTVTVHRYVGTTSTPRLCSAADATPIATNTDQCDQVDVAALSQDTTFSIPTGSPVPGQWLAYTITTSARRALTWTTGTNGFAAESTLPLATVTSGGGLVDTYQFRWNSTTSKWSFVATGGAVAPVAGLAPLHTAVGGL